MGIEMVKKGRWTKFVDRIGKVCLSRESEKASKREREKARGREK